MSHSTATDVIVFAIFGLVIGWYVRKTWLAHADIPGTIQRIAELKRVRSHNGGIVLLVFLLAIIVFYGLVNHQ
jgi:hypothetical protein